MKTASEIIGTVIGGLLLIAMLGGVVGGVVWALAAATGHSYQQGWKVARSLLKWTALAVAGVGVGSYYLVSAFALTS